VQSNRSSNCFSTTARVVMSSCILLQMFSIWKGKQGIRNWAIRRPICMAIYRYIGRYTDISADIAGYIRISADISELVLEVKCTYHFPLSWAAGQMCNDPWLDSW
jgi:hypothetical protein